MKKIFCLTTIFLFLIMLSFENAFCASAKDIFHNVPDVRGFQAAGLPFTLTAKLNGTRNVNNKVRLIAVIDGMAVDVPSNQVYWDEFDRPVYDFEIFYPKKTLSYAFIVEDPNQTKRMMTRKYVANRLCEFPVEVSKESLNDPLQKTFEEANIEERKAKVMDEIYNLLKWYNKKIVAENEEN
ncbi:MAG: hypothetical protein ACOX3T_07355 [Bdellovibrionota bacterium]